MRPVVGSSKIYMVRPVLARESSVASFNALRFPPPDNVVEG